MLIEKYTSNWAQNFLTIKQVIESALYGINHSIEHVGSTAIQNLDSKPIIDIDIIYTDSSDFNKIKLSLENLGYYHNGNQGIEDREVFKRKDDISKTILDTIKHHLYVCSIDSKALENHILFRNHLRNNENARIAYQRLKYDLAQHANHDKKRYAALKEQKAHAFIISIIEKEKNERTRSTAMHKANIDHIISQFFGIFNNKTNEMPDWDLIYKICIPEARILKKDKHEQTIYNLDNFLQPRKAILTDGTLTDFEEKEIEETTTISNNIAQRISRYKKQGILNGQSYSGIGTKLFHLVNTTNGWLISFVTWEDDKS